MFKNFNKKVAIVILFFGILLTSFPLAGAFIYYHNGKEGFPFKSASIWRQNTDINKSFAADGIKEININTANADIKLLSDDSNEIRVHFYGKGVPSIMGTHPELYSVVEGSTLIIKTDYQSKNVLDSASVDNNHKLDIYIPAAYAESLKISTVSGDSEIETLKLNEFGFSSVSGDFRAEALDAASTQLATTSGDVRINELSGNLDFQSVSGDINARIKAPNESIKLQSTSGDLTIKLPEDSGFSVDFKSVSGEALSDFSLDNYSSNKKNTFAGTRGNGKTKITANTASGDLKIER